MSDEADKARDLRERAALPESEGNLAALLTLMAQELEERVRPVTPPKENRRVSWG